MLRASFLYRPLIIAGFMVALAFVAKAQESDVPLPRISSAELPLYPHGALRANLEGNVRLEVTTDGHRVVSAIPDPKSIQPLAQAAEANVRTWKFDIHEPISFTVTYTYKLVTDLDARQKNPRISLKLPTEVEVDERRWSGTVDMPSPMQ